MKLPEAISVAVTPMALPAGVPGLEMSAGSARSNTVGIPDYGLKQTLRPIHESRFGLDRTDYRTSATNNIPRS